jgi:uncharacterized membrane protein HdeD (DUF308 family)
MKKTTKSDILSQEELHEIVDDEYAVVENELEDKKITGKTIAGSILGGGIAAIVGGILWSLQLIFSGRIYYLLFVGLILLCYGIIKGITRQSKNNMAVFIATAVSVVLACAIGWFIYSIIGYRE